MGDTEAGDGSEPGGRLPPPFSVRELHEPFSFPRGTAGHTMAPRALFSWPIHRTVH